MIKQIWVNKLKLQIWNKFKTIKVLKEVCRNVESDVQIIEPGMAKGVASNKVKENSTIASLIDSFNNLYYELAAFADVHNLSLSPPIDVSTVSLTTVN